MIRSRICRQKELISAEKFCWGNTEDVNGRIFKVSVSERGSTRDTVVFVSADAVKEALDRELEGIRKKPKALQEEFSEL